MTLDAPTIPDLRVESLLGEGGMGRVYAARRTSDDRLVALKVIRPRSGGVLPDAYRRRFLRETAVMRGLAHPGLPAFVDAGVTDDCLPWLAVELLTGTTLEDAAGFGRMEPAVLVPRLTGLLTALGYLHDHGLVHRDIKPANVFLALERTVLLDLGLVFVEEGTRLTATGEVAGTLATMTPEQLRGEPASARTDLYQLAATAWMALHEDPPRDSTALIGLASFAPDPVPLTAATGHPGLDAFLTSCLQAFPDDRPVSAAAAALLLSSDPTQDTRTTVPSKAPLRALRAPGRGLRTSTVRERPVPPPSPPPPRHLRRLVAPLLTVLVLAAILLPRVLPEPPPAPRALSAAPAAPPPAATPAQTAMAEVLRLWDDFLERHPGWTPVDEELLSRGLVGPTSDPAMERALDLLEPLTGSSPGVPRSQVYATLVRVLRTLRNRRAHRTLTAVMIPMINELPREDAGTDPLFVEACALATTSAREWRSRGINRPVADFEAITARLAATDPSPSWAALFRVFQAACIHFRNDRTRANELRAILDAVDPLTLPPEHRWRHAWVSMRDAERFEQTDRARSQVALGTSLAPSPTIRLYFERREMESTVETMFGKPRGLSRDGDL